MRFEEHVRSKIGATTFDRIRRTKPRTWQTALKYFEEYVKRNYDPDDKVAMSFVPFTVNDGEAPPVEEGYLAMSTAEVWSIFEPVIGAIIRLIESQIHRLESRGKTANGIVLVGGFGQSECLFKKLVRKFEYLNPPPPYPGSQTSEKTFQILQPNNAWTAVVRGGVLRGLEGTEIVLSRISRRYYGVRHKSTFDPRKHPMSCRVWGKFDEVWEAKDRMTWYIRKGQTCESEEPISFSKSAVARCVPHLILIRFVAFQRTVPDKGGQSKTAHCDLVVCDTDQAPDGFERGETARTRVLCTMEVDLNKVPKKYWRKGSNFQA